MKRQLEMASRAMWWGAFVFALYFGVFLLIGGGDVLRIDSLFAVGLTFVLVAIFGSWLVPQLGGAAKLLAIAAALGIGTSLHPDGPGFGQQMGTVVMATSAARLFIELFVPRAKWSSLQLGTAFLAVPISWLMLAMGGPGGARSGLMITFSAMSMGLAAVAPRPWMDASPRP